MWSKDQVQKWVKANQHHYQGINLPYGLNTRTYVERSARDVLVKEKIDFMKWPNLKGKSFLDVGSNIGAYCFEAFNKGAKKVVGIDANPGRVQCASQIRDMWGYDKKRLHFVSGKVQDLRTLVGDKPVFDVVLFLSVYHHLDNVFNPIKDLSLVVKPSGMLYFECPCIDMNTDRDVIVLKFKKDKAVRFYPTTSTMIHMLSTRFRQVEYMGIRQDPRSKKHMFLAIK